jgi:hypothetical protein
MPDLTAGTPGAIILSIFIASIPGVLVALLSQYLEQRRETENYRRIYLSARGLLAAEVNNNRAVLETFWHTINDLDSAAHSDLKEHLAMTASPVWRRSRSCIRTCPSYWSGTTRHPAIPSG